MAGIEWEIIGRNNRERCSVEGELGREGQEGKGREGKGWDGMGWEG